MPLKDYFKKNVFVTKKMMANAIETNESTLFCLVAGRMPSLILAARIELYTDGEVTCVDMYRDAMKVKAKKEKV